jgi:hypothetical protein
MDDNQRENDLSRAASLEPRSRARFHPGALRSVGMLALGVVAAGCGGGASGPGVANAPTTVATVGSSVGGAHATGLVAYASCMRAHGVPGFPDPASGGGIPKAAVISAFQAVSNAQAQAATSACQNLLPAGGSLSGQAVQTITAQDRQDYLKAATCMRSHGFPDFPDPTFENNSVQVNIPSSIDQDTSGFTSAATICTRLIPAGLPGTRRAGNP